MTPYRPWLQQKIPALARRKPVAMGNSGSGWPLMERALISTRALAGIETSRSPE